MMASFSLTGGFSLTATSEIPEIALQNGTKNFKKVTKANYLAMR